MDINNLETGSQPKKNGKKKILVSILVFTIIICITNTLILADSVFTKVVTYKAIGSFVEGDENEKEAEKQGNLGNYNVVSKKNTLINNKDSSYTLTLELEFTNYGEEGHSFSDAVSVTAYQEDKEIQSAGSVFDLGDSGLVPSEDEADIKVRNGKSAKVILTYIIRDAAKDINIDMTAGNNDFTYTVKLDGSAAPQQEKTENKTEAQTEKKN